MRDQSGRPDRVNLLEDVVINLKILQHNTTQQQPTFYFKNHLYFLLIY